MDGLLARVRDIGAAKAIALCAALYFATTGVGLLREGYNVDDWRHITGGYQLWVASEGRWVAEFIFRVLFGERFLTPLQVFLSFFGFLWIAFTLAKYAAQDAWRSSTAVLIFAAGVNFPYLCDALSFNAHILAFTLALAASLAGFHIIFDYWSERTRPHRAVIFVASAQLIAISLGIYQPFALFGLVVPILCALRSDATPLGVLLQRTAVCALACALAVGLYLVQWRLYAAAIDVEILNRRFENPTLAVMLDKLGRLPQLWKALLTGGLLTEPRALRIAEAMFAALTMLAAAGAALVVALNRQPSGEARAIGALRVLGAAAAALLVLPVIFWFATADTYAPSRAVGYLGFVLAAVLAASASLCIGQGARSRWIVAPAAGALVAMGAVHAWAASSLWDDRARLSEGDVRLAQALYLRAASLPGHDGRHLRLVGDVHYPDLNWGDLLGLSVFHNNNPNHGIFNALFTTPMRVEAMNVSPRSCRAFPHPDAAYVYEGVAHICLNDFQTFLPVTNCVRLGEPSFGELCVRGRAIAHVTPSCAPVFAPTESLRLRAMDGGGKTLFERDLLQMSFPGVMMGGRCYRVTMADGADFARIAVSLYRANYGEVWLREYPRSDFSAPRSAAVSPSRGASPLVSGGAKPVDRSNTQTRDST